MKIGDQKSDSLALQSALVFVIAAVSLYAIGHLAMVAGKLLVNQSPLTPEELARFVYPDMLSPKPLERMVFLSVALSVVPVLALATFLVRGLSARGALPTFRLPLVLRGAAWNFPNFIRAPRLAQWLAIILVMIFSVYAGGYYRWIGADEVDYKFTTPESLDAVVFSIMRIGQGGTCMVDVMAQYGCYGEFFRPLWSIVTPSVKAITSVFFLLYLVAIFAAMRFSCRIIRSPEMLLLCGVALIAWNSFYTFFDIDLQYWPLRTLFPCLALWMAARWQEGPRGYKAAGFGMFSALAIGWNLDSGGPVTLALAILIALSGCTQAASLQFFFSRERFFHLGLYCLSVAATLAVLFAYLSLKAGSLAHPGLYIHYQQIFYVAGFLMLPMPALPHAWGGVTAIILLALAALATCVLRGRWDKRYELIGFAAILAIGSFVYYTGRSHIRVLELVSWLPLILSFALIDRCADKIANPAAQNFLRVVVLAVAILFVAAWLGYYGSAINDRWATQLNRFEHATILAQDARFIAGETGPGDKIAVFAPSQGSLVLASGRTLDMAGPGITETLLWADADKTMQTLQQQGPRDLFIDPRVRSSVPYTTVYSAFENRIRAAYVTRAWAPNGRILHMVRRHTAMDSDAVPYDRPSQVSGTRADFPLQVTKALTGPFKLEMNITASPQQGNLAVLASTTEMDLEPFQGMVMYHQARMGKDHWVLALGDGSAWKQTPPFTIPSGRPVTMEISYAAPKLEIAINGKAVFAANDFTVMKPTVDGLYLGDWIAHMHRTDTPTDLPLATRFESPNDWKIQDRRFNGDIAMARLLP